MKLFLICGEKSGNDILSQILDYFFLKIEKQHIENEIVLNGVVDKELSDKYQIKQFMSSEKFSVLGISDIVFKFADLLDNINDIAYEVIKFKPDLVISVDAYELNIRIVKKITKLLKKNKSNHCIQFWHIVAPSVWCYWQGRAKRIAKYYNRLFYLLPFEEKYFKPLERKETTYNKGFISTFIGYPATFQKIDKNIVKNEKTIGFMLGSRIKEVKRHKNLILHTILKLKMIDDKYEFIIFATKNTEGLIKKTFSDMKNLFIVVDNEDKIKKIQKCSVIVAKSGTNNIEIGALNTAMITYYKTSLLTKIFIKIFVKTKFVNLINIILKEENIPEFLQKNANSENLSKMTYYLLTHDYERNLQIKKNQKAIKIMQVENKKHPAEIVSDELISFIQKCNEKNNRTY